MNIAFIIGGLFLLTLGTIGVIVDRKPEPPEPRHGELQVRQEGGTFWTYRYNDHPGWSVYHSHDTKEAAIKERDAMNRMWEDGKVVE